MPSAWGFTDARGSVDPHARHQQGRREPRGLDQADHPAVGVLRAAVLDVEQGGADPCGDGPDRVVADDSLAACPAATGPPREERWAPA